MNGSLAYDFKTLERQLENTGYMEPDRLTRPMEETPADVIAHAHESAKAKVRTAQRVSPAMALGFAVGAVAAALGRTPGPEEVCLYASTAVIVCLLTGSVNLPCTFVLTAEKSLAGIILCDILVSALFAGGIFALRQVMDVKLHMRAVLGMGAALSALCYGISWIIAARQLPMRDV